MKRRSITISIIGVITLIVTIIISTLCIADWSGLTVLAFSTIIWTEVVFFGGMVLVEWAAERTEQVFTRSALYVLFSAYAVINIPVSILYIAFLKQARTSFVIVEVVLLAVIAIIMVVSLSASKRVYQCNQKTMENLAGIEAMIERLNKLAVSPECETYSSALKKLSDDLRFTDISASAPEDTEIAVAISSIEIEVKSAGENTAETIKETLVRLNSLIAQRKLAVCASKKGRV
jgi:hypothetical protein